MDVLDVIEIGSTLRGRVGATVTAVGVVLLLGWSQGWPIAHPIVQAAMDKRIEWMVSTFTSSLNLDVSP